MVKIVKQVLMRADQSGEDPHLGLLMYRSTPRGPGKPSPAETMTQRKFRAILPIRQHRNQLLDTSREVIIQQKQQQAEFYNRSAHPLPELHQYQPVRVQLDPRKPVWQQAMVLETPTYKSPRAYQVQTEQGTFMRNRRFLRPATTLEETTPSTAMDEPQVALMPHQPQTPVKRPHRDVHRPQRLIEDM